MPAPKIRGEKEDRRIEYFELFNSPKYPFSKGDLYIIFFCSSAAEWNNMA